MFNEDDDGMLTVDQARAIANAWRPRFSEEEAFNTSWRRYMDIVKDQSPGGLVTWLETDQQRDAVRASGIVQEPLLPTHQDLHVELGDCPQCGGEPAVCPTCHGLGWVRRDLPITHSDFGEAIRCPTCSKEIAT